MGIRRMHESLVALAGRLQAVHTQVDAQKEQYLNLRKYVLKDPTNVFDTPSRKYYFYFALYCFTANSFSGTPCTVNISVTVILP